MASIRYDVAPQIRRRGIVVEEDDGAATADVHITHVVTFDAEMFFYTRCKDVYPAAHYSGQSTPRQRFYRDSFKGYNALDVPGFRHYRINHGELFADKHKPLTGLRVSGTRPSGIYGKLMGFRRSIFTAG